MEFSIEGNDYYPWQDDLFVESLYTAMNGRLSVTDQPGWGVELNLQWLAAAQTQKKAQ